VEEKSQIFILSMEGGEPVQLTTVKYGANNPKWSPDGKKIYSHQVFHYKN
jgi:Tol biopolymer transport system component